MPVRMNHISKSLASPDNPIKLSSPFQITVLDQDGGQRLDQFLARNLSDLSRSAFGKLIRRGRVCVDGRSVKAGYRVRAGNRVEVSIPSPEPISLVPQRIDFPIQYEDDYLLVLSKPPGLVVHPACGHTDYTLVHGLLYHYKNLPEREKQRPGIVHRLDKDTSGIILVAKTEAVLRKLSDDFKKRRISKTYHALLLRSPVETHGRIVASICRHPVHRKKMAVCSSGGRYAATRWQVLEHFSRGLSFVEIYPETGRTHQIRVHMASLKCPVAGDRIYGGSLPARMKMEVTRQLLHASTLEFKHPHSGRKMKLTAPLWPDMQNIIDQLRAAEK